MAVSIPIVSEFINTGIKQAERAFVDIRKQVSAAEGTMGKFKAAGKGVFDAVSANAASFAAAVFQRLPRLPPKAYPPFKTSRWNRTSLRPPLVWLLKKRHACSR